MGRDSALTERLRTMLAQLISLTANGTLHWERQLDSAHRYSKWNDTLLIIGPASSLEDHSTPRYLFATPLNSPSRIEINSSDRELRASLLALIYAVEAATANQEPRDPFALTQDALSSLFK